MCPVCVRTCAGEDFGFYCAKVPCSLGFLGIRNETLGSVHALHNPRCAYGHLVLDA
jgi:IAA-amino acid hydrolase